MNRILTSIKSNIGRLSALTSRFTLIVLALLICIPCPCAEQLFAQRLNESVYFKNFVRHSDGTFCTHTSPTATFTVYLNRDQRKIVMENAPRWDTGGDPNIDGKGVFGVELGNFAEPSLAVGDSVFVRFTCNETGEQGILSDKVTAIPFYRFPLTLTLARVQLPPRIENVQLTIDEFGQRVLTWQHAPDITSTIYRRAVSDTALNGLSRKLYTRIAENNTGGSFIDTCTSVEAHGYIIIPKRGDRFGSHSDEAVDFPRPPHNVTAAVSNTSPFQVALTWEPPAEAMSVSYRIYRSLAPGVIMSQENLLGATQNTYFIDSLVTEGTTGFYRIVAVNRIGIPSQPSQEVSVLVQKPLNELPDLDVLFISRSPKYPRFAILYDPPGYNPKPDPLTENTRHVPLPGELMCYSATVGNSGGATMGNFNLKWYVDSALVQQESCGMLFPKQRLTSVLRLPWETEPSIIRCEVQPADGASEATKNNNSLKIRTNALSFHFYVEQNIIELFGSHKNPMNSYGFEDWAQVHINQMNRFFADARYPGVTPDGVPEAVFLDTVSYFGNGLLPPGGTHAPEAVVWDGQWGFTGDPNAINYFENIVLGRDNGMDWALLHELGHQIGLIDLYQMDVSQPQMRVIEPRTGQKPPLRPIAWDVLHYCSRSQYIMHSNFQNGFSDHSAGALRRNTGKRRGYFGEYLADIPKRNSLLVQRKDGTPVQFAEIRVYQKQDGQIPDLAKFTGLTDSTGRFEFPRNADSAYYGGLRVKNPFSTIHSSDPHVVATNATLFIRVAKGDSVGYAFMDICGFNVAFWSGDSISATYPLTISQWHIMPISGLRSDIRIQTATYKLFQNYPNPFNATTEIRYQLPISTSVRIDILNILGQRIRTLVNGKQHKGNHSVAWDGNDDSGRHLSSGIYYYIFKADEYEQTAKMLLLN